MLLFALIALVPAVSLAVLGFSAVTSAEASAKREVSAMISGAADRLSRTMDVSLRDSEAALSNVEAKENTDVLEEALRRVTPSFADAVVFSADRRLLLPKPTISKPPFRTAACDALSQRLAAEKGQSRAAAREEILSTCEEAQNVSNRFLWPLAALDALRDKDSPTESARALTSKLVLWVSAHAEEMPVAERQATLLDAREIGSIPKATLVLMEKALTASPSRRDDITAQFATTEASSALEQTQRSLNVIAWKGGTNVGAIRRLPSGVVIGFVVHVASIENAIAERHLALGPDLRAEVIAGAAAVRDVPSRAGIAIPGASIEVAPLLLLLLLPRDGGLVERQAQRRRLILGATGIGSILVSWFLAALIYRQSRELERTSDLRTDFVSAVSHELRTPIASVRMLAELLESGRVERNETAEVTSAIAREAKRLGETVDRLLHFSRMGAGRMPVDRKKMRIAVPLMASIAAFQEQNPKGPAITHALESELSADVDSEQLQLALGNLLANAKKYAGASNPIFVTAKRQNENKAAGPIVIGVTDKGPGVPKRDQRRIFEPFERVDDRLSRATEGSGIGLSLVMFVAKAHGGKAWVESEEGKGATFYLSIEG